MKKALHLTMLILISMTLMFCTKEGPRGPQGPAGTNGTDGINGTNGANGTDGKDGKDGNANVTTYMFTDSVKIAWGGNTIYLIYDTNAFHIPDSILEYGVVLVYHKVKDAGGNFQMWYPVPGLGYNAIYSTRLYLNQFRVEIKAYNPNGSTYSGGTLPQLAAIKVVLIPASTINNMKKAGDIVNFDDYDETMRYFRIKE